MNIFFVLAHLLSETGADTVRDISLVHLLPDEWAEEVVDSEVAKDVLGNVQD
jgi:hypothetical protein